MTTRLVTLCIFLSLSLCKAFPYNASEYDYGDVLVVQTNAGRVRGAYGGTTIGLGKPIYSFRSIPFAEPPVGNLRFEPPRQKAAWSGILDVTAPGAICIQGSDPVQGSEDCLYLKVYTTQIPDRNTKLPVMVWIYGGAFFAGAPDFSEHSPDHLLDNDVIVVSFHYRVGMLGFFSTEDTVVPGNQGLKDQVMALEWIKANIQNFGGDPDRITLFGQSAGAVSIGYLLQSDKTAGLFHRAIMQSGNPLDQWALTRSAKDFAEVVANDLNIATTSSQAMLNGFKAVSAEALQTSATGKYSSYLVGNQNPLHGLPIGPVAEPNHAGAVVTGLSHEKLRTGQFQQVPIIIGHTNSEALMDSLSAAFKLYLFLFDLNNARLVPVSMNTQSASTVGRNIKAHYFGSKSISGSDEEFMAFSHDDQFERGIQEAARLYAQRVPTYYYEFAHEGSLYGVTDRTRKGVGHNEDLGYIFDFGYTGSQADYNTRNQMVKMWTNFAKTGNPTPQADPVLNRVIWPVIPAGGNIQQLVVNNGLTTATNPNANNQYWRNLFSQNGNAPFSTF